jgi:branched-chain amino acid transport system permease protein
MTTQTSITTQIGKQAQNPLRTMWLPILVLLFLIAFPYIVGALTGSSPMGVPRGDRMIMRGESVRWQAVFIELFVLAILTMSYNLLFGFTGVVSFGHALFFGLGGYIMGLALEYTGLNTGTAILVGAVVGILVCGVLGIVMGLVTLRLRGVYFAIFTLAVSELFFIYFSRLALTKAEDGFAITELPTWFDPSQNRLTYYYIALALFALTYVLIRRLVNSPTGAVFKAIRENEDRAQSLGYNTLTYKLLALFVAGTLASAAGMVHVILNKKVGPEVLSSAYTIDPLLMTIIGGIGTFTGPVIGSTGLHLLDTVLREATITVGGTTIDIANIWSLLLGVIFIVVVLVFPQGVVGTLMRWRNTPRKRTEGMVKGKQVEQT